MMDNVNEGYDEGNDEGDDEGGDKVEWLILRCRDVGIADMPDILWGFCAEHITIFLNITTSLLYNHIFLNITTSLI